MQYRKSKQREKILRFLREADSHPTAELVYAELKKDIPGLSLGTVYRNLNVLITQGLVQRLPFGSGYDRFEARIAPHYHLVCDRCGKVSDFEMPQHPSVNESVQKMTDFKVLRHRIDFFGLCKKCQNQNNQVF